MEPDDPYLDSIPNLPPGFGIQPLNEGSGDDELGPLYVDAQTLQGVLDATMDSAENARRTYGHENPFSLLYATWTRQQFNAKFAYFLLEPGAYRSGLPRNMRQRALRRTLSALVQLNPPPGADTLPPGVAELAEANLTKWVQDVSSTLPDWDEQPQGTKDYVMNALCSLPPKKIAEISGITTQELWNLRSRGVGPPFVRTGSTLMSIRYPAMGVIYWLKDRTTTE